MSEGKVISINPDDFSVSKSPFTKKKRASTNPREIKVKSAMREKNLTMNKRSIVNMMRKIQKERMDMLAKKEEPSSLDVDSGAFNKDFKEATDFFETLAKKTETAKPNRTIRHRTNRHNTSIPTFDHSMVENVSLDFPSLDVQQPVRVNIIQPAQSMPLYGCLKNGTLPTYRTYMNHTRKVNPIEQQNQQHHITQPQPIVFPENITEILKEASAVKQLEARMNIQKSMNYKPKNTKQKKTFRRTYKVGRSKVLPHVGVLISNKTLRNNISTKTHILKQTSMDEVKKHLIKRGLIKVGSTAPNDVLRKIYESTMLLCGEVQNHNPDNLLHNFIHDTH
jgi:hypothetical protein